MNRRWRNLVLPRKRRFDPPWAVVAATPPALVLAIGDQGGWRPRWTPLARRGRFLAVPPPATAPTAPTYVPAVTAPALRQRALRSRRGTFTATASPSTASFTSIEPSGPRPRWIAVRRGRFQTVPQSAPFVAPFVGARRARVASVRHGQFQALPQVSAPAVSQFVEPGGPRQRPFLRRGRFLSVPPTVVTAGIGPVVPPITEPAGPRARTYTPRRGTFFRMPLVGLAPTVPTTPAGFLVSNRPTPLPVRRGLTRWVPPTTLGAPDQISPTRAFPSQTRRGRLLWTPPTQPAITTPWAPDTLSPTRTARPTLVRRGRFWVLTPAPVVAASTPVVGRIKSRRPTALPTRRGNILDNWPAIVSMPGFVCQDFATTSAITAYSATVSIVAYAATTSIDADSATLTIDAYGGTATNCGR